MTFRIKLEELKKDGKHKHLKDIYLDTLEDTEKLYLFAGYLAYANRKSQEQYSKMKEKEIMKFIHSDLFDLKSKGKDITDKEYYENETKNYN